MVSLYLCYHHFQLFTKATVKPAAIEAVNGLLILDVDAYSSGLNFVLGQAFPHRRLGAVYLPRIKEEFYGLKPNNELFYERMVKECVHELGHIFGFNHCPDMLCVMHFSNSLSDTDFKRKSFCATCRIKKPIF
ncbi:MAG TPA: hypothetical protein VF220_10265 [Nitrososphaeraceae archaeon]